MFNSAISVLKGTKLEFLRLIQADPVSVFNTYIKDVPSKSDKEKYPIFLLLPGIRQFIDRIGFGDARMDLLEVSNSTFYNGFDCDFDTFDDSKQSMGNNVKDWALGMADKYKIFKDAKCQALLEANSTAFDGTAMFATSRGNIDTGSNTINNLITGTLSGSYTYATFSADFVSAEQAALAMKDADNLPFNPMIQWTALVPSQLKNIAETVLSEKMSLIYNGSSVASNQYAGNAKVVVNPFQSTSDNDWYLINEKSTFPAFLFQTREGMKWEYEENKKERRHEWWYTFRMGYSFLNPMSIIKINN